MVNTIYLLSFVETPRKFIIAELSIRKLGSSSVLIIPNVTFCRWSGVSLMSLLIAVPPEAQINTHKIVKGVLYWTTTQQQLISDTPDHRQNVTFGGSIISTDEVRAYGSKALQ